MRHSLLLGAALALVATASWLAPPASAADRIYWGNEEAKTLSFASLSGGGGGDLAIPGGLVDSPQGLAIDSVADRIYWVNYVGLKGVAATNLDGSGGGMLNTSGATVDSSFGLAIDPGGGRVYWGNAPAGPDDISFARIDGSGGGNLNTAGATELNSPLGIAVDPPSGRVYWSNHGAKKISYARIDESGGGDVNTTGATVSQAQGVAVDSAAGRIYWANGFPETISFANLDGSGGADLNTAGATVKSPVGVAIDPGAGRIYWANSPAGISYANLDGSGGGDLEITGASFGEASFPVLHRSPAPAGPPAISVAPVLGSQLSCTQGAWAPDLLGAFLYRAPRTFTYSWTQDGAALPGFDAATLNPKAAGEYRCTVAASNGAGTTPQTSPPRRIETASVSGLAMAPRSFLAAAGGPSALASAGKRRGKPGAKVSFRLNEPASVAFKVKRRRRGRGPKNLPGRIAQVGAPGPNSFRFTGRLRGRNLKPGRYILSATATGVGKPGDTRSIAFRIGQPSRAAGR